MSAVSPVHQLMGLRRPRPKRVSRVISYFGGSTFFYFFTGFLVFVVTFQRLTSLTRQLWIGGQPFFGRGTRDARIGSGSSIASYRSKATSARSAPLICWSAWRGRGLQVHCRQANG